MKNKVNFSSIPRCNQVWEDMQIIEGGRLCPDCKRCIHDFRQLSDLEIAYIHATSTEPVCGYYRAEQLQFNLPKSPSFGERTMAALRRETLAGIAVLASLFGKADAQIDSLFLKGESIEQTDSVVQEKPHTIEPARPVVDTILLLKGKVMDESGELLIGASVMLIPRDSNQATVTDFDGVFELPVTFKETQIQQDSSLEVLVTYVGYAPYRLSIPLSDISKESTVLMVQDIQVTQTQIISFGIDPRYAKRRKKPWRKEFWQKLFTRKNK